MTKFLLILLFNTFLILSAYIPEPIFGLKTTKHELLSFLELKTKVLIRGPYAEIQSFYTYKNHQYRAAETYFYFPYAGNSIFYKFEAKFNNRTIIGKIIDKDKYAESYFGRFSVGKIEAYETVEIILSVIQPLEHFMLEIPAITDWLNQFISPQDLIDLPKQEWDVYVEINSNKPVDTLRIQNHWELSESNTAEKTYYKAVWNVSVPYDENFFVSFPLEGFGEAELLAGTHPNSPNDHVLLFNLVLDERIFSDKFEINTYENAKNNMISIPLKDVFAFFTRLRPDKFLFLIDRSDSLKGARFETLKETLITFLKTLPKHRVIKLLSFGSTCEYYKINSDLRENQLRHPNVKEAIEFIKTLEADMSERNILKAMKYAVQDDDWSVATIITDEEIPNPQEVLDIVKEKSPQFKVCHLGINDEEPKHISHDIEKTEKCWSGVIVDHKARPEFSYNFDFLCENSEGKIVYEDRVRENLISADSRIQRWMYLDNIPDLKFCELKFECESLDGTIFYKEEMKVFSDELKNAEVTDFYHKIAYHDQIKNLWQNLKGNSEENELKELIASQSKRYQVLSDWTSFVPILYDTRPIIKEMNVDL